MQKLCFTKKYGYISHAFRQRIYLSVQVSYAKSPDKIKRSYCILLMGDNSAK